MKHVRIWFSKTGTARYISHLDLNRCMDRAMHKAKIPLWYTEGFHPHAFMTFALPLSLFMDGRRESMDIKLEEEMNREELIARLNEALPPDIQIFDVTEPVMKPEKLRMLPLLLGRSRKGSRRKLCWLRCRLCFAGKKLWWRSERSPESKK